MQCPKPNVVKIGKTFTNLLTTTALVSMELTRALGPAYGQIIADPGAPITNRPSIGVSSAGNVPSINITTPSSGVSLNRYQQFNVDPSGVILNNAASDSVSSLGSVSGNSNLSVSGPAQTIVNVVPEAQGTHSRLNGPVAVSGTNADVIIVNPTGIECQGCRFENAGTTTLSTGTATITGSEVNLDVSQGTLLIGRNGASADGDLSLAARHVYIDGAVTADGELLVSGGAHGLNTHTKEVTPRPASGAPTSAYAIDASEFGAMSGSAIRLIGNEVGLGVRALGDIQSASSIVINSMGGVQTGSVDAETVDISADGAVRLFDNVTAAAEVRISGQDVIVNPGAEINTTGDVAVIASGGVEVHGEIRGLNTVIEAGDWFLNDGFVFGAESVDITAETTLENVRLVEATFEVDYQSWIDDYYDAYFELAASDGLEGYLAREKLEEWGVLTFVEEVPLSGASIGGFDVTLVAGASVENVGGALTASNDLIVDSLGGDIVNTFVRTDAVEIADIDFHPGEILAGSELWLIADRNIRVEGSDLGAGGDIILEALNGDIVLRSAAESIQVTETVGSSTVEQTHLVERTPRIGSLDGSVYAFAAEDITATGALISAAETADLTAIGNVTIDSGVYELTEIATAYGTITVYNGPASSEGGGGSTSTGGGEGGSSGSNNCSGENQYQCTTKTVSTTEVETGWLHSPSQILADDIYLAGSTVKVIGSEVVAAGDVDIVSTAGSTIFDEAIAAAETGEPLDAADLIRLQDAVNLSAPNEDVAALANEFFLSKDILAATQTLSTLGRTTDADGNTVIAATSQLQQEMDALFAALRTVGAGSALTLDAKAYANSLAYSLTATDTGFSGPQPDLYSVSFEGESLQVASGSRSRNYSNAEASGGQVKAPHKSRTVKTELFLPEVSGVYAIDARVEQFDGPGSVTVKIDNDVKGRLYTEYDRPYTRTRRCTGSGENQSCNYTTTYTGPASVFQEGRVANWLYIEQGEKVQIQFTDENGGTGTRLDFVNFTLIQEGAPSDPVEDGSLFLDSSTIVIGASSAAEAVSALGGDEDQGAFAARAAAEAVLDELSLNDDSHLIAGGTLRIESADDAMIVGGAYVDVEEGVDIRSGADVVIASLDRTGLAADNALAEVVEQLEIGVLNGVDLGGAANVNIDQGFVDETTLASRGAINIQSGQDFASYAATITAGGDLTVGAGGTFGNYGVRDNFTLSAADGCIGQACGKLGFTFNEALMQSDEAISLFSVGDFTNKGATISAVDGVTITTLEGDFEHAAASGVYAYVDQYRRKKKSGILGSSYLLIDRYEETASVAPAVIEATAGDTHITVGGNARIDGAQITSSDTLTLHAGGGIDLIARNHELIFRDIYEKKSSFFGFNLGEKYDSVEFNQFDTIFASLTGKDVHVTGGGGFLAHGASIKATEGASIQVNGDIFVVPIVNEVYENIKHGQTGFLGGTITTRYEYRTDIERSAAEAGQDLLIESENGNVTIQAANLTATGDITITADPVDGQVAFLTETDIQQIHEERYNSSLVWWTNVSEGSYSEDPIHSHIMAGGSLILNAGDGVLVEYKDTGGDLKASIEQLSQIPELAWMREIQLRNDAEFQAVEAVYQEWYDKTEGLTPAAMALIAVAVAAAAYFAAPAIAGAAGVTPGATASGGVLGVGGGGSFVPGGYVGLASATPTVAAGGGTAIGGGFGVGTIVGSYTGSVTLGYAASAATTTLVTQSVTSLINNQGDIGATLDDIASSATLKAVATAAVTAGLAANLNTALIELGLDGQIAAGDIGSQTATETLQDVVESVAREAIQQTTFAAIETGINGGDFGENIVDALIQSGATVGMQVAQTYIGDIVQKSNGTIEEGDIEHALSHAVVGGTIASVQGGSFVAGAVAGASASLAGTTIGSTGLDDAGQAQLASLIGGLAALLSGGDGEDVGLAAAISSSAHLNNYLKHAERLDAERLAQELVDCRASGDCTAEQLQEIYAAQEGLAELSVTNTMTMVSTCQANVHSAECGAMVAEAQEFLDWEKRLFPDSGLIGNPRRRSNLARTVGARDYLVSSGELLQREHVKDLDQVAVEVFTQIRDGEISAAEAGSALANDLARYDSTMKIVDGVLTFAGGVAVGATFAAGCAVSNVACLLGIVAATPSMIIGSDRVVEGVLASYPGPEALSNMEQLFVEYGIASDSAEAMALRQNLADGAAVLDIVAGPFGAYFVVSRAGNITQRLSVRSAVTGDRAAVWQNEILAPNGGVLQTHPNHPLTGDALPRAGARPVTSQGAVPTCGQHSCAMLTSSTGQSLDPVSLINQTGPVATNRNTLAGLLSSNGVPAVAEAGRSLTHLQRVTRGGSPAIVRIEGNGGFSHWVVVDGVTTRQGQRVVAIRDPHGQQYFSPVSTFQSSFTGDVVRATQ